MFSAKRRNKSASMTALLIYTDLSKFKGHTTPPYQTRTWPSTDLPANPGKREGLKGDKRASVIVR
jgi:hypothetical protein